MPGHPDDIRYMEAAIRLARRNLGLTATNPSVATIIVNDGVIVGTGVTAAGGRPHAETIALAEAGERARGATAYVTLEPCAHHGRTPPCAEALVAGGVARVVGAATDPDPRVSGQGYAILRAAGIEVTTGVLAATAADVMSGYLIRSVNKRPEVILKLAVSTDGMIGRWGEGQVPITGEIARAQTHVLRGQCEAILVGIGTVLADDPELTCRLPGLEPRSPMRIVLDGNARLPPGSKLVRSARDVPVAAAISPDAPAAKTAALRDAGVRILPVEMHEGRMALPELLEDLASQGVSRVLVEGGAETAAAFIADRLVDRICLFTGQDAIGTDGVASPFEPGKVPAGFVPEREAVYGRDRYNEYVRG